MLEKVDLSRKLRKAEYRQATKELGIKLGELQRRQRETGIPVMVVFEGWEGSGKGAQMNQLILPLDPRGFRVQNVTEAFLSDPFFPPMSPFWKTIPPEGRISIYNRSWYRPAMDLWKIPEERRGTALARKMEEIRTFERQLVDGGYLIIKIFLHIDKDEQKKRLKRLAENEAQGIRSREDLKIYRKYDEILPVIEEIIGETDRSYAPWTVVEAHDRRFAAVKVLSVVARELETRLSQEREERPSPTVEISRFEESVTTPTVLSKVDLSVDPPENVDKEIMYLQKGLRAMEYSLYRERKPMIVAFEGWDAAGKGGCIKRLTQNMDPRGYEVIPVGAPNDFERRHHYLWRFWQNLPKAGHVAIFDRTWYGRVLVERVEGLCSKEDWQRAYSEINDMEKQWREHGAIIVKFWLQIDKEEQLKRFQSREQTPEKSWKITDEDWRNREKWDLYEKAVEEMLWRTSTTYSPWTIVEANSKDYARIKVLKTVLFRGTEALKSEEHR